MPDAVTPEALKSDALVAAKDALDLVRENILGRNSDEATRWAETMANLTGAAFDLGRTDGDDD